MKDNTTMLMNYQEDGWIRHLMKVGKEISDNSIFSWMDRIYGEEAFGESKYIGMRDLINWYMKLLSLLGGRMVFVHKDHYIEDKDIVKLAMSLWMDYDSSSKSFVNSIMTSPDVKYLISAYSSSNDDVLDKDINDTADYFVDSFKFNIVIINQNDELETRTIEYNSGFDLTAFITELDLTENRISTENYGIMYYFETYAEDDLFDLYRTEVEQKATVNHCWDYITQNFDIEGGWEKYNSSTIDYLIEEVSWMSESAKDKKEFDDNIEKMISEMADKLKEEEEEYDNFYSGD